VKIEEMEVTYKVEMVLVLVVEGIMVAVVVLVVLLELLVEAVDRDM